MNLFPFILAFRQDKFRRSYPFLGTFIGDSAGITLLKSQIGSSGSQRRAAGVLQKNDLLNNNMRGVGACDVEAVAVVVVVAVGNVR